MSNKVFPWAFATAVVSLITAIINRPKKTEKEVK